MFIKVDKLKEMFWLIPIIGIDTKNRCLFFMWLNRTICIGNKIEDKV